jgi:hypothetical protein
LIRDTARFGEDASRAALLVERIPQGGRALDAIINLYAAQRRLGGWWNHADDDDWTKEDLGKLDEYMLALESVLETDKLLFTWKEKLCISNGDWNTLRSLIQDPEVRKAVLEDELRSHRKKEEDEGLRVTDDTTLAQLVQVLRDPETHVARLRGLREKTDYLEKRLRFMTDHGDDLKVRLRDTTMQINNHADKQPPDKQPPDKQPPDKQPPATPARNNRPDSLDTASRSLIGSLGSTLEQQIEALNALV